MSERSEENKKTCPLSVDEWSLPHVECAPEHSQTTLPLRCIDLLRHVYSLQQPAGWVSEPQHQLTSEEDEQPVDLELASASEEEDEEQGSERQ